MIKNLTDGFPLKLILRFSLPLIFGNLFQQCYNLVDSAIVGQTLGANALGSVGATSSLQFLILGFCIGISIGFTIPIAKEFGANNYKKMRIYIYNGIILLTITTIILTLICIVFCHNFLHLLKTPKDLYPDTYNYIFIIFIGIFGNILYNYSSSILRALGNSRTPFLFLVFSSILNIFLDFFCILTLKWGVSGAAIATVFSQTLSGILCVALIVKKYEILKINNDEKVLNKSLLKNLFSFGFPMGINYSITAIGSMFIQSSNNSLGTLYTSAFATGTKIKQFAMSPFDAIATGTSTFISQNYGAKKIDRIKSGIKYGLLIGLFYGIFIGIILILFGNKLSMIFLPPIHTDIIRASALFLQISGYAFWILGILVISRLIVQGLGFSYLAVLTGVIEMLARVLVSIFLVDKLKYFAICIAEPITWITGSIYIVTILFFGYKKVKKELTN